MRNNADVTAIHRRATLAEVAALAGVSTSTASRVLTHRGDLGAATRARVLAAAASLQYDRGSTPRGRTAGSSVRLIELVLGEFGSAWSDHVVAGARREAFARGYDLVLTQERDDPADDWPARVAARRSSGVVLALITPTRRQLQMFAGFSVPTVLLDPRSDPTRGLVSIGATNERGGADAAAHLIECGYDRFAIATSALRYRFGRARERGFRDELERRRPGREIETIDADWDGAVPASGLTAVLRRARGHRLGVFATNDAIARTLCAAALASGRGVPDDVGIVGFDDDEPASGAVALTTVRQPVEQMAATAVHTIDDLRHGGVAPDGPVELPTELVVRASTGPRAGSPDAT